MTPTPSLYTASEIAGALGSTAAMVRRRLAGVAPSGTVRREERRTARGWEFAALPATMRELLTSRAAEFAYDGPDHLLADAANPAEYIIEVEVDESEGENE